MTTAFADWLDERGETPYAFALRLGMNQQTIYALAGIRTSRPQMGFKTSTLARVEAETGIPVQRLYTDWAQVEPRPPRRNGREKAAE